MSEATKRARSTDPETSHAAAERMVASGKLGSQKTRVLAAVHASPGCTSAEFAKNLGVDRYMVARRLPDLEREGLVRKGEARECAAHGGPAVTWWPIASAGVSGDQLALIGDGGAR